MRLRDLFEMRTSIREEFEDEHSFWATASGDKFGVSGDSNAGRHYAVAKELFKPLLGTKYPEDADILQVAYAEGWCQVSDNAGYGFSITCGPRVAPLAKNLVLDAIIKTQRSYPSYSMTRVRPFGEREQDFQNFTDREEYFGYVKKAFGR